jgi:hypothetical protein
MIYTNGANYWAEHRPKPRFWAILANRKPEAHQLPDLCPVRVETLPSLDLA